MKLCRFKANDEIRVGLIRDEDRILDLSAAGVTRLERLLESDRLGKDLEKLTRENLPEHAIESVRLVTPVEQQEVWAAGVTYFRSKTARMEESSFSASAYDRVYDAVRPELFFKSLPEKVVSPNEPVGIRKDARWSVPEPEIALMINSRGQIAGYTIGNDMSSRDIEGENLLYLPQAKVYRRSCAVGPFVTVEVTEEEARSWQITLAVERAGAVVFDGETSVALVKRSFDELVRFLLRCQSFPHGAVLLTGTGIVPPDEFTLQEGDLVRIGISGIGVLVNSVMEV